MAPPTSKKKSPAEPFKNALGLCVRAIAGDDQVQVIYAAGKPELDGHMVQLPEPSRVPTKKEIAVIRGWADSFALTAAMHDAKLHRKLAPDCRPGPRRLRERRAGARRVDRLPTACRAWRRNLTAKVEDQYAHGRFAHVTEKAEAPIEEALALIVRERLTGQKPPKTAQALVDVWRDWVEEQCRQGRSPSSTSSPRTRRRSAGSRATCCATSNSPTKRPTARRRRARATTRRSPTAARSKPTTARRAPTGRISPRIRRPPTARTARRRMRPIRRYRRVRCRRRRRGSVRDARAVAPQPVGAR